MILTAPELQGWPLLLRQSSEPLEGNLKSDVVAIVLGADRVAVDDKPGDMVRIHLDQPHGPAAIRHSPRTGHVARATAQGLHRGPPEIMTASTGIRNVSKHPDAYF